MTEKESNAVEVSLSKIKGNIKRDYPYIIMCLVCLIVLVYTLAAIGNFVNQCNAHWINEMEECACACVEPSDLWNKTFSFTEPMEDILNGSQDNNQDT